MNLIKILRISATQQYKNLQKQFPIHCPSLDDHVFINRRFLNHFFYSKNSRTTEELNHRILIIPLIKIIIKNGKITSKRKEKNKTFFRVSAKIENKKFSIIIEEDGYKKRILSIFMNIKKKPVSNRLAVPPTVTTVSGSFKYPNYTHKKNKNQVFQNFQNFIQSQNLENQKILIMVSGGIDSCVLLHIAQQIIPKNNLAVFHLNHNLRTNSVQDFEFVENLCKKYKVKFYGETLPKLDSQPKNLESYWRKQRQNLVQKCAKDFEAKTILTAHHATDLVETMLFRLTKGCGVNGLSPFNTSTKPFWQIPKSEIEKYAEKNKLEFHYDSTNDDLKYERNLIRKKILPELRKITPNLEKVFVKESQIFAETTEFISNCHSEFISESQTSLALTNFLSAPTIIQQEFLIKIAKSQPSFSEVEDCLKWLLNNPKGNSKKEIGETKITIEKGNITW